MSQNRGFLFPENYHPHFGHMATEGVEHSAFMMAAMLSRNADA
jgi:hypothetical protein